MIMIVQHGSIPPVTFGWFVIFLIWLAIIGKSGCSRVRFAAAVYYNPLYEQMELS